MKGGQKSQQSGTVKGSIQKPCRLAKSKQGKRQRRMVGQGAGPRNRLSEGGGTSGLVLRGGKGPQKSIKLEKRTISLS